MREPPSSFAPQGAAAPASIAPQGAASPSSPELEAQLAREEAMLEREQRAYEAETLLAAELASSICTISKSPRKSGSMASSSHEARYASTSSSRLKLDQSVVVVVINYIPFHARICSVSASRALP